MNNQKTWNDLCWYLLQTYPEQEDRAEGYLKSFGIETLAPMFAERRCNFYMGALTSHLRHGGTLSVEPPLVATWKECELFLESFEDALAVLESRNTAYFTAHLTGINVDDLKPLIRPAVYRFPAPDRGDRFAFLLRPLTTRDYADIDPSLGILSDQQISRLAECVAENFDKDDELPAPTNGRNHDSGAGASV